LHSIDEKIHEWRLANHESASEQCAVSALTDQTHLVALNDALDKKKGMSIEPQLGLQLADLRDLLLKLMVEDVNALAPGECNAAALGAHRAAWGKLNAIPAVVDAKGGQAVDRAVQAAMPEILEKVLALKESLSVATRGETSGAQYLQAVDKAVINHHAFTSVARRWKSPEPPFSAPAAHWLGTLLKHGFEQQAELLAKIVKKGSIFFEVPISYNGRSAAEGKKIKFFHFFPVIWQILIRRFI
jgi:hypothetical protein